MSQSDEFHNNNYDPDQNIELNNENRNNDFYIEDNNNQKERLDGNPEKGNQFTNFYKKSAHPGVALTTVILKVAALISFICLDWFTDNQAIVMIIVIILTSMDFWYMKNISGRILVGLRWWNTFNPETNQEKWSFESKNEIKESTVDRSTFWTSLYGFTGAWLILSIWELIRFNFIWLSLCLISLAISGVNLYGFFRCSKMQQNATKKIASNIVQRIIKK